MLRSAFGDDSDSAGAAVNDVIAHALKELAAAGAELVDVEIPRLDHYVSFTSLYFTRSRDDMNRFFAERPEIGISGVDEVRRNGTYDRHLDLFEGITDGPEDPRADPEYLDRLLAREEFARIVMALFIEHALDAVVFPDVKSTMNYDHPSLYSIRSAHRARDGPGSNASLKYCVSRTTSPPSNSMMLIT